MANENQNMEKLKAVEISTGQIVLPPLPEIDVTPYIGTKAKIVQAIVVKSPFINKKTGEEQYSLYVKTETVGTIGDGENKVELSGSKFFGLYKDEDRNIGWADNTICGQFMKKMGCNQKEQLIGKEVTLQKNNKGYLTLV